jgi:hypothetical protein
MSSVATASFELQYAIDRAESVSRFLDAHRPEQVVASLPALIEAAVQLGETLHDAWRHTFDSLVRLGAPAWLTVEDFEEKRNAVRHLFFTHRAAMEKTLAIAEGQAVRARQRLDGLDRLEVLLEMARDLEESFGEIAGLTVEQVRQKVAEHKRKYHGQDGAAP